MRWASGRQVARKVLMKEVSEMAKLPLGWMDECAHGRKEGKKRQREEREDTVLKIQPSASIS